MLVACWEDYRPDEIVERLDRIQQGLNRARAQLAQEEFNQPRSSARVPSDSAINAPLAEPVEPKGNSGWVGSVIPTLHYFEGNQMTTSVVITTTVSDGTVSTQRIVVGELAQKHVLRSFNPAMKEDDTVGKRVDATKALCAALIQQMIDLRIAANQIVPDADEKQFAQARAAERAIELVEAAQMQLVKANFVQA